MGRERGDVKKILAEIWFFPEAQGEREGGPPDGKKS